MPEQNVTSKCDRCHGDMLEEEFVVGEQVKRISARQCLRCGRLEYRTVPALQDIGRNFKRL